jgi:hypothetical protein
MAPSPILIPGHKLTDASKQGKVDPIRRLCGLSTPIFFAAVSALLIASFEWARRWLLSGATVLTYCILLGASKGYRILPFIDLWTLLVTLNLVYAVAATSWLLYGVFIAGCYPTVFFTCLFQFSFVANLVRARLRAVLKQLQFVNDKIAFFNIPALEIDTDVDGLMVVRGVTISFSTLTIVAHGIELGIKLSDDMEIAIQTEKLTVALFRGIEIGDVYGNLKGGEFEMTFHKLESTADVDGDAVMLTDTPLLRAATFNMVTSQPGKIKMTDEMTDGSAMKDSSAKSGFDSLTRLSPDDERASKQYHEALDWIQKTSPIRECGEHLKQFARDSRMDGSIVDDTDERELRAAICSQLHNKPSVPHPPSRSVRVTTLRNLSPPYIRNFMHRLPMLLRLLLVPLSYFHPLSIASITGTGSGKWIKHILEEKVFENYGDDAAEIRRLQSKISTWLSDANFALELADVTGLAQVPFMTAFDIICYLGFGDVMAYRTLPEDVTLKQVIRLGGADATFAIPSFLLPHHEHILPPVPTAQDKEKLAQEIEDADGKPKTIQAEHQLEQAQKDEASIKMSVHASLPACFDQELLNFVAALVKATKVVELEKEPNAMDGAFGEFSGFKDFGRNLHKATRDGMKKAVVGGIVNAQWIAKMVGKVTKRLETAQGDIGYSGNIPVKLDAYRPRKGEKLPSKLLV